MAGFWYDVGMDHTHVEKSFGRPLTRVPFVRAEGGWDDGDEYKRMPHEIPQWERDYLKYKREADLNDSEDIQEQNPRTH